jgi:hypothetical protein
MSAQAYQSLMTAGQTQTNECKSPADLDCDITWFTSIADPMLYGNSMQFIFACIMMVSG